MEFYLKIPNGLFLCCHEQMKKNLEAPSRSFLHVQMERKRDQFCALMYEDTCQKKKRKQISSMRKGNGRPTKREQAKDERNPRSHEGPYWLCDLDRKRAIFAHEYVIFYSRGN